MKLVYGVVVYYGSGIFISENQIQYIAGAIYEREAVLVLHKRLRVIHPVWGHEVVIDAVGVVLRSVEDHHPFE